MIVRAAISVKDQWFCGTTFFICGLERASNKLRAVDLSDSISHDHSREQIQDHADVVVLTIEAEACYIAYSHFIGACDSKLPIQIILEALLLLIV